VGCTCVCVCEQAEREKGEKETTKCVSGGGIPAGISAVILSLVWLNASHSKWDNHPLGKTAWKSQFTKGVGSVYQHAV
jgi:hypothetical protein